MSRTIRNIPLIGNWSSDFEKDLERGHYSAGAVSPYVTISGDMMKFGYKDSGGSRGFKKFCKRMASRARRRADSSMIEFLIE